ncbi:MAG: hypothetical protein ACR2N6_09040 [Miltoncostaeaceae bacterium]
MAEESTHPASPAATAGLLDALEFPFYDAMASRRSRRVGLGMSTGGGVADYTSQYEPVPLSEVEEALLVSAATGVTGMALGDLAHPDGLGALVRWSSRAFPSPCNNQGTELFFTNDDGTHFVDVPSLVPDPEEIAPAGPGDREGQIARMLDLYRDACVRIGDGRADLPTAPPGLFGFNAWNANRPGTTLFIPVTDMTVEYLNVLFVYLDSTQRVAIVDEANGRRSAGLDPWVGSGRLDASRQMGIVAFEQRLLGIKATEAAFMTQNMAFAQQCIGLGGFTFSAYNSQWVLGGMDNAGLGFRFATAADGARFPIGRDGLYEAFVPEYHGDAHGVVEAFLAHKYAGHDPDVPKAFTDPGPVVASAARPDEETVELVTSYIDYVHRTFGRFPAYLDPMYMRIVSQAHHVDPDFYDEQNLAGALPKHHRDHMRRWHPELCDEDGNPPEASR